MAQAIITLKYVGNGPTAGNQIIADGTQGPKAKTLYAYGTLTASSGTYCTETQATVQWIDGVQAIGGKTVVLSLNSVAVDTSVFANGADYYTVQGTGQVKVGDSVTIAGFANSGNNLTTAVKAVSSSYITVVNSSAVAETNPAGTMTDVAATIPVWASFFYAGNSGDSAGAAAALAVTPMEAYSMTSTGCTLFHASLVTTAAVATIGAVIAFSS